MDIPELYRLSPLETAVGWVFGESEPIPERTDDARSPRQVLEEVILASLRRGPCGVSFSGGRDSSLVLAVAVHVARREGLPEPIPHTLRYPVAPDTEESDWQELVVRHLGIEQWERATIHDELDLVGPYATGMLLRHGPVWPAMAYTEIPALEAFGGGSLLSGEGGDEVLGHSAHRIQPLAALARSPMPVRRWRYQPALRAAAPSRVRAWWAARNLEESPWLKPAAVEYFRDWTAKDVAHEPLSWADSVRRIAGEPSGTVGEGTRLVVSADYDVVSTSPLLHPEFVDALARWGGWLGPGNRAETIRGIAGDLLPDAIIDRTSKAEFSRGFVTRYTAEFAQSWDGGGLDEQFVEPELVRRELLQDHPSAGVAQLLQAAWLANHSGEA